MVERTLISFPSQLQLIDRLQHLVYLSSSMVFISGEKGSGKSTLIEQLANQLPDNTKQAFIHLAEPISTAQIRQHIISQLFEQPLFDAEDSLRNILLLLKDKQYSDSAWVIVIDNAQLLPEQLLLELTEVITQQALLNDNEINFILLSDALTNNQIIRQIKQFPDQQSITTLSFKLSPLDINEAQQLLTHSLTQSGYAAKIQHQDALTKQLLNCQGLPEKILSLATQISSGHLEEHQDSWFKTRFPAILLMLILLAIIAGLVAILYPQFIKPQIEVEIIIESDAVLLDEIPSSDLTTDQQSHSSNTEPLAGKWANNKEVIVDNNLSVGEADSDARMIILDTQILELTASARPIDAFSDKKSVFPEVTLIATDEGSTGNEIASGKELKNDPMLHILPVKKVKDNVFTGSEMLFAVDPYFDTLVSTKVSAENDFYRHFIKPNIETDVNELVMKAPSLERPISADYLVIEGNNNVVGVQEISITVSEDNVSLVSDEMIISDAPLTTMQATSQEVLLAINANLYTLQLAAMRSESALQVFIKEHQLTDKNIYVYRTIRNGKNWYMLIYGQFKSYKIALQEGQKLSSKLDSWVKKYTLVHQDLQSNEQ